MKSHNSQTCLSELLPGEEATILRVKALASIRQRLMEMGFVRGQVLKVAKVAPLGDPMEIVVKGYHLFLRREESACILVERRNPSLGEAGAMPAPED